MLKHNLLRSLLSLLSLGLVLSACNNDDEDVPPPSIIGTWEITSATFNPAITDSEGNTLTDAKPIVLDLLLDGECDADNFLIMNEDNSLTIDEGAVKCNPDDPQQSVAGSWTLNNNALSLSLSDIPIPVVVSDVVVTETTATGTIQAPVDGQFVPIDLLLTRQ